MYENSRLNMCENSRLNMYENSRLNMYEINDSLEQIVTKKDHRQISQKCFCVVQKTRFVNEVIGLIVCWCALQSLASLSERGLFFERKSVLLRLDSSQLVSLPAGVYHSEWSQFQNHFNTLLPGGSGEHFEHQDPLFFKEMAEFSFENADVKSICYCKQRMKSKLSLFLECRNEAL